MNEEERSKCQHIIHAAAVSAAAIGAVPIPFSDLGPICAIQVTMVGALARVFGLPITEESVNGLVQAFAVGEVGKLLTSSVIKFIPVIGWGINATVAAGITEAFGWETVERFAKKRDELAES